MGGTSFPTSNKMVRCGNAVAVGTSTLDGDGVDTSGFREVTFIVAFGAITDGTPNVHVQGSDDDAATDAYSDLAASEVDTLDTDDNKLVSVTVRVAEKKWNRVQITRGGSTGSVVDGIIAVLSLPTVMPVVHDASVAVLGNQYRPAEGTK